MAAEAAVNISVSLTGLGDVLDAALSYTTSNTPTKKFQNRQVQASADTAEALELGSITSPSLLVIECIANDVDVDLDYVSSFDADFTINEGEAALITSPSGTVYIKNNDSSEVSTIDVMAVE